MPLGDAFALFVSIAVLAWPAVQLVRGRCRNRSTPPGRGWIAASAGAAVAYYTVGLATVRAGKAGDWNVVTSAIGAWLAAIPLVLGFFKVLSALFPHDRPADPDYDDEVIAQARRLD